MHWLAVVVAALAISGCRSQPTEPPPAVAPPSVFLLMVDTLRADYLGAYGFDGPISPNLDRLAAESIVFENCSSVAPWTKPAIASLFTGLDPTVHRVLTQDGRYGEAGNRRARVALETDVLPDAAVTLAEALRDQGYATGAFVANPWINAKHGFAQGFDRFDDRFADNATPAERVIEAAEKWLARFRSAERPVFLYLHFMDVHDPYDAPEADVDAVRGSPSFGTEHRLAEEQLPVSAVRHMRLLRLPWTLSDEVHSLREWRTRYAGGVRAFDRRIGPFLERLRAAGWLERTILIVTSDHGEELFEHGHWMHGHNLFEHQLAIPLFVRMPNGAGGGTRTSELSSLVDIFPTVLAAVGAPARDDLTGFDLDPTWRPSGSTAVRTSAFATGVKSKPKLHSVRDARHKLVQDVDSAEGLLFDLSEDLFEQRNIWRQQPTTAFALGDELDRHLAASARHAGVGREAAAIPPAVEERLRALGYLE